jgi:hypothetical protein
MEQCALVVGIVMMEYVNLKKEKKMIYVEEEVVHAFPKMAFHAQAF